MSSMTRRNFVRDAVAAGAAATAGSTATAVGQPGPGQERTIKIIGLSCSPRKGKTTATSLRICLEAAGKVNPRVETELIELAGLKIDGSLAAGRELEPGERDDFPALVPKLRDPQVQGIIVGTPVYFGNMSSLCKAFLDRCITLWQDDLALSNKVAGVLAVGSSRNGGQEVTIQSVQVSLLCQEMIVVGNGRPGPRIGATVWSGGATDVTEDEYGMTTARSLGRRVAEVALKLNGLSS